MAEPMLDQAIQWVREGNNLVARVKAQDNFETTVLDLIEESDDEKLQAYRKCRDEQQKLLDEADENARKYARTLIPQGDNIDPEEAKKTFDTLKGQVNAVKQLWEKFPVDFSQVVALIPE